MPEFGDIVHEDECGAGEDHHGAEDGEEDLDGEARLGDNSHFARRPIGVGDVVAIGIAADALGECDDAGHEAAHPLAHQVAVQVRRPNKENRPQLENNLMISLLILVYSFVDTLVLRHMISA